MKTFTFPGSRSRHCQSGTAVIVVLALLSIILLYVAANVRSVRDLQRELKLTEQRQIQRLHALPVAVPPVIRTNVLERPEPAQFGS